MKRKLILITCLLLFFSNLATFVFGLRSNIWLRDEMLKQSHNFSKESQDSFNHEFESYYTVTKKRLSAEVTHTILTTLKKDATVLSSLVQDNSIIDAREFLAQSLRGDESIVHASLVVQPGPGHFHLWQWIDRDKHSGGIGFGYKYDKKAKQWVQSGDKKLRPLMRKIKRRTDIAEQIEGKLGTLEEISKSSPIVSSIEILNSSGEVIGFLRYKFSIKSLIEQLQEQLQLRKALITKLGEETKKKQDATQKTSEFLFQSIANTFTVNMFIATLLGAIFMYFWSQRLVTPIQRLTDGAERMAQGSFDKVRVERTGDEVERLSVSFNEMVAAIDRRDQELHKYQQNLETILEERTRELEDEKAKNIQNSKLSALGEMAAGIAHEINNPLGIIRVSVSLGKKIVEKQETQNNKLMKIFERIDETVDRTNKIIKGLKDFSRQGDPQDLVSTTPAAVFESVAVLFRNRIKLSDIRLEEDFQNCNIEITCNMVQISQVIFNLVSNAKDAIEENDTPRADRWISISAKETQTGVCMMFENGGKKIDPAVAEKIFDPFFTTKPVGQGTGLGLSISRGLIESHGGSISVDLNREHTCIAVHLPFKPPARDDFKV